MFHCLLLHFSLLGTFLSYSFSVPFSFCKLVFNLYKNGFIDGVLQPKKKKFNISLDFLNFSGETFYSSITIIISFFSTCKRGLQNLGFYGNILKNIFMHNPVYLAIGFK